MKLPFALAAIIITLFVTGANLLTLDLERRDLVNWGISCWITGLVLLIFMMVLPERRADP